MRADRPALPRTTSGLVPRPIPLPPPLCHQLICTMDAARLPKLSITGIDPDDSIVVRREKAVALRLAAMLLVLIVCFGAVVTTVGLCLNDKPLRRMNYRLGLFLVAALILMAGWAVSLAWYFYMKSHALIQYSVSVAGLVFIIVTWLLRGCSTSLVPNVMFSVSVVSVPVLFFVGASRRHTVAHIALSIAVAWAGGALDVAQIVTHDGVLVPPAWCPLKPARWPLMDTLVIVLFPALSQAVLFRVCLSFLKRILRREQELQKEAELASAMLAAVSHMDLAAMDALSRQDAGSEPAAGAQVPMLRILNKLREFRPYLPDSLFADAGSPCPTPRRLSLAAEPAPPARRPNPLQPRGTRVLDPEGEAATLQGHTLDPTDIQVVGPSRSPSPDAALLAPGPAHTPAPPLRDKRSPAPPSAGPCREVSGPQDPPPPSATVSLGAGLQAKEITILVANLVGLNALAHRLGPALESTLRQATDTLISLVKRHSGTVIRWHLLPQSGQATPVPESVPMSEVFGLRSSPEQKGGGRQRGQMNAGGHTQHKGGRQR